MTEILPQSAAVPPSDYVIIGGAGDLSLRKIVPALFLRYVASQVTDEFRIFIISRQDLDIGAFKTKLEPHCEAAMAGLDNAGILLDQFLGLVDIVCIDISVPNSMADFADKILTNSSEDRPVIFYLSIAPSLFGVACQRIDEAGLVLPQSRLVVEKPLGHDRVSSQQTNDELLAVFKEEQIYRIDHYLGKETVQNLMALRFANVIFEALWNNRYVDNIQITVAETVGVGDRAGYYDNYGAIRDMLQNHLLQLLCLVAMEPPARFNADQVRNEKKRVLEALRPAVADDVFLGQYQGYAHEVGAPTTTETYVALKVLIDNSKEPGPGGMRLFPSELNLSFVETFNVRLPDAYERLLMDIARGNQTLFMRLDEVLAAWAFIDPIVEMAQKRIPLMYRVGSFGPEDTLFAGKNYSWLDPKEDAGP